MKQISSTIADQPAHDAGKPIELACMDLYAVISASNPEAAELRVEPVNIRNTRMDEYGVGYQFEIASGKTWKNGVLSRLNFGVDHFSLDMSTVQYLSIRPGETEVSHGSKIQMNARIWHWNGDEELAKSTLLNAMDSAMKNHIDTFHALAIKSEKERLEPVSKLMATTKKSTARP